MKYEDSCKSCYGIARDINSICTAPCGHKLCFSCIVLIARLNHRCPCCKEDIVNAIDKNSPFPLELKESEEEYGIPTISLVAVTLHDRLMSQDMNTKKCFIRGSTDEVYMTSIDLELVRLDLFNN